MTNLELVPIRLADAAAFVALHHRHHGEPRGHKFSIGLASAGELVAHLGQRCRVSDPRFGVGTIPARASVHVARG